MTDPIFDKPISQSGLITEIVDRVETIIKTAEHAGYPMEIDPHRAKLFEVFAIAHEAGLLTDLEPNAQAESIAERLSERWQIREVAKSAFKPNASGANPAMRRVQLLWSACRMWMDWSYAWSRWPEFHGEKPNDNAAS